MGEHKNFHAQDGNPQSGPILKKAREELGLSHEDVERATKIRVRYLEAMERDDYEALPGAIYAQGFLKTYANYLDLDGEELSRVLRDRREAYDDKPPVNRTRTMGSARSRRGRRRRVPVIAILGVVLALTILAVATGLYFVGLQASRSSNESSQTPASAEGDPTPGGNDAQGSGEGSSEAPEEESPDNAAPEEDARETGEQNVGGAGENEAPSAETAEPEQPAPAELPPESLTMDLRVEGNISWLNIESDGEVVFSQVAESGFVQTFEANDSITVWSGNAGAVFISVNGQDYGRLGESGQTVVREFNVKTAEN